MTDENGHTTSYTYDLAGNLTKTTFADGDTTRSSRGHTTRSID